MVVPFLFISFFVSTFMDMKDNFIEVHIKIPEGEYKFILDFKEEFGISIQDFIIKSVQDNIRTIKQSIHDSN